MSIMGPQSSGKSTLMNHAFGTSFREMDELSGYVLKFLFLFISRFVLTSFLMLLGVILC